MKPFESLVPTYMSQPVVTVSRATPIREVAELLGRGTISAVPVCESGAVVGVVSRTDLLREGLLHAGARPGSAAIAFPAKGAEHLMTPDPVVVTPAMSLREAAVRMLEHHVHRVFVVDGGACVGVLSSHDLARAVRDARVETPLSAVMTVPLVTIDAHAPISAATELLAESKVSGLVVTEERWPVGLFSQIEALASQALPRGTRVDEVLDPSMVCFPETFALHRAAATAFELGARRVIACRQRDAVGIITGTDFVKIVAAAA